MLRAWWPLQRLIAGARPAVALRGKPGGRAPRHPGRDSPGDALGWASGRRKGRPRAHLGSGTSAVFKGRASQVILTKGARSPVALRGKPKGRAPRHPVRDPPGDACRRAGGRRKGLSPVHLGCGKSAAFQGRASQVDIEIEGARPPSPCEGSRGAVHPVILVAIHQETPVDGVQ